jgi:hypothetical protein
MDTYLSKLHTATICAAAVAAATALPALAQADLRITSECRTVRANQEWQPTRIIVRPQEFVCVAGDGLWSHGNQGEQAFVPYYGPEGYGRDNPSEIPGPVLKLGALVGRIGSNATFIIGRQMCFVPQATGELMLSINDDPGAFANNAGRVDVHVAKWPASQPPQRPAMNPQGCRR